MIQKAKGAKDNIENMHKARTAEVPPRQLPRADFAAPELEPHKIRDKDGDKLSKQCMEALFNFQCAACCSSSRFRCLETSDLPHEAGEAQDATLMGCHGFWALPARARPESFIQTIHPSSKSLCFLCIRKPLKQPLDSETGLKPR